MPSTPASAPLWKQEVNRRLAAHRSRRPMPVPVDDQPAVAHQASSRAAEVAARVAQRYASRPSYAEPSLEPELPVQAARPVRSESAPVAARTAPEPSAWLFDPAPVAAAPATAVEGNLIEFPRSSWIAAPASALSIFEVDPVLFETPAAAAELAPAEPMFAEPVAAFVSEPEPVIFVEETTPVSFVFEPDPVMAAAPAVPFFEQPAPAANVDSSYLAPASEPWIPMPTVSRYTARRIESEELLEMLPDPQPVAPTLEPADMGRRLLAGFVDASLIGLAFVAFAAYTVSHMEQVPELHALETTGGIALGLIALLYMATFSILSIATPGMRYAGLALSSFACRGTRPEQRLNRFGALLLALAPAGLGVLWAIFDEEGLGWHDRLSQTYPRKR